MKETNPTEPQNALIGMERASVRSGYRRIWVVALFTAFVFAIPVMRFKEVFPGIIVFPAAFGVLILAGWEIWEKRSASSNTPASAREVRLTAETANRVIEASALLERMQKLVTDLENASKSQKPGPR